MRYSFPPLRIAALASCTVWAVVAFSHESAYQLAHFFAYFPADEPLKVLEVGSWAQWGTTRVAAPPEWFWLGVDIHDGHGVDVILDDPYRFPLASGTMDLILAQDVFEHVDMFWLSFLEMVRVLREGGFMVIGAPAGGDWHYGPRDSWRFKENASASLELWARYSGYENLWAIPHADAVRTYLSSVETWYGVFHKGSGAAKDWDCVFAGGTECQTADGLHKFDGALPHGQLPRDSVFSSMPIIRFDLPCFSWRQREEHRHAAERCPHGLISDSAQQHTFDHGRKLVVDPFQYRCCQFWIHNRTIEGLRRDGTLAPNAHIASGMGGTGAFGTSMWAPKKWGPDVSPADWEGDWLSGPRRKS